MYLTKDKNLNLLHFFPPNLDNFLLSFLLSQQIKPFMKAHLNRDKDKELLKLTQYLKEIAKIDDFLELNHKHWER